MPRPRFNRYGERTDHEPVFTRDEVDAITKRLCRERARKHSQIIFHARLTTHELVARTIEHTYRGPAL